MVPIVPSRQERPLQQDQVVKRRRLLQVFTIVIPFVLYLNSLPLTVGTKLLLTISLQNPPDLTSKFLPALVPKPPHPVPALQESPPTSQTLCSLPPLPILPLDQVQRPPILFITSIKPCSSMKRESHYRFQLPYDQSWIVMLRLLPSSLLRNS